MCRSALTWGRCVHTLCRIAMVLKNGSECVWDSPHPPPSFPWAKSAAQPLPFLPICPRQQQLEPTVAAPTHFVYPAPPPAFQTAPDHSGPLPMHSFPGRGMPTPSADCCPRWPPRLPCGRPYNHNRIPFGGLNASGLSSIPLPLLWDRALSVDILKQAVHN